MNAKRLSILLAALMIPIILAVGVWCYAVASEELTVAHLTMPSGDIYSIPLNPTQPQDDYYDENGTLLFTHDANGLTIFCDGVTVSGKVAFPRLGENVSKVTFHNAEITGYLSGGSEAVNITFMGDNKLMASGQEPFQLAGTFAINGAESKHVVSNNPIAMSNGTAYFNKDAVHDENQAVLRAGDQTEDQAENSSNQTTITAPATLRIYGHLTAEAYNNINHSYLFFSVTADNPGGLLISRNYCGACGQKNLPGGTKHGLRRCLTHYSCAIGGSETTHNTPCGDCGNYQCLCTCFLPESLPADDADFAGTSSGPIILLGGSNDDTAITLLCPKCRGYVRWLSQHLCTIPLGECANESVPGHYDCGGTHKSNVVPPTDTDA